MKTIEEIILEDLSCTKEEIDLQIQERVDNILLGEEPERGTCITIPAPPNYQLQKE